MKYEKNYYLRKIAEKLGATDVLKRGSDTYYLKLIGENVGAGSGGSSIGGDYRIITFVRSQEDESLPHGAYDKDYKLYDDFLYIEKLFEIIGSDDYVKSVFFVPSDWSEMYLDWSGTYGYVVLSDKSEYTLNDFVIVEE